MLTAVSLVDEASTRRRLAFGEPKQVREVEGRKHAFFVAGKLVAYVVERGRARALFVFRTPDRLMAGARIAGVSPSVDLLFVASSARSIRKFTTALRFLANTSTQDLNTLSDGFWIRLADYVVARRSFRILPHVSRLLRAEPPAT